MLKLLKRLHFFHKRVHPARHIIGYPKTGNTWLRFLLGRYFQLLSQRKDLLLLEGTEEEGTAFRSLGLSSIRLSHGPLTWESQTAADLTRDLAVLPFLGNEPPIVLIRHPLDALLSFYLHSNHQKGHEKRKRYPNLAAFIDDPTHGLKKYCHFYSLWAPSLSNGGALVIRYEDMKRGTQEAMLSLLRKAQLPIVSAALDDAIRFASFENMKNVERTAAPSYKASGLNVFATGDVTDPMAFHIRTGLVGGHRQHLSADDVLAYEEYIAAHLPSEFGY